MSEMLFLVDAGGVRTVLGSSDGTPVTRSFRITANGPTAAECAARQLIAASASRRREAVLEPWARVSES